MSECASESGGKLCYFFSSRHQILIKFDEKLLLRCRMEVYQVHQNLHRIGDLWGAVGCKIAPGTLSPYLNTGFC